MEIYFCDLCSESVPAVDLTGGRAFRTKDRVVCAQCNEAMGGAAPEASPAGGAAATAASTGGATATLEAPPRSRTGPRPLAAVPPPPLVDGDDAVPAPGGGGGVLVGLVALILAAGGFAVLSDQQDEIAANHRVETASLSEQLLRIESRLAGLAERLPAEMEASEQRVLRQSEASVAALSEQLSRVDGALESGDLKLINMGAEVAGLRETLRDKDNGTRLELVRMNERLGLLEQRMRELEQRTIAVEEGQRIVGVSSSQRPSATTSDPRAGAGSAARTPQWQGLLADLDHESPGIRLEALYALGATRDPATVPYIMPMLDDEDIFVRMTAIGILAEDFQAREAVPRFIDALEHDNSAVRETAMIALRDLTGREFRFDPSAAPAERAKRVKAWRDWWERNGEEFLAG